MKRLAVVWWLLVAACSSPSNSTPADAPDVVIDGPDVDAPDIDAELVDGGIDAPADAELPPDAPPGPLGDPVAELANLEPTCSIDRWCFKSPAPMANTVRRIFGSGADNLWIVGLQHTILQWNGHTWRSHSLPLPVGVDPQQNAMTGGSAGPNNAYVVFGTNLEHWDGRRWTIFETLPPTGNPGWNNIWVDPEGAAWATKTSGDIRRFWPDGTHQDIPNCGCFAGFIWGTSAHDVWLTTINGLLHYDGTLWSYIVQGKRAGAAGRAENDVWITSDRPEIQHWDGQQLTTYPVDPGVTAIYSINYIASNGPDDVWFWVSGGFPQGPRGIHWDGHTMTTVPFAIDYNVEAFVGAAVDGRWWLHGARGVMTRVGTENRIAYVSPRPLPIGTPPGQLDATINEMWGTADNDMYFVNGNHTWHWDGATLTEAFLPTSSISGVKTATGTTEVWGSTWHWDGVTLTTFSRPDAKHVWALAPGEAIFIGPAGKAYFYAAGAFQVIDTHTTEDLRDVWGPDPDHVLISGMHGTLLKWDRTNPLTASQDPTMSDPTADLDAITGAEGKVWIQILQSADVYTTAPTGWQRDYTGIAANGGYSPIFAVSATNVVVASTLETGLTRWNGSSWKREDSNYSLGVHSIFQPPGGHMLMTTGRYYPVILEHD